MQTNLPAARRRWERHPINKSVGLVLKADHFKADDSGSTVDISLRGASVRTKLPLVPGQWIGFVTKGKFRQAIPTRVVWVREDTSSHEILAGLELLGTNELMSTVISAGVEDAESSPDPLSPATVGQA
jgi:hypothetical protein